MVRGDTLKVGAGDQIIVDGMVVGNGRAEVDESQVTGESDHIAKAAATRSSQAVTSSPAACSTSPRRSARTAWPTSRLVFNAVDPLGTGESELRDILGEMMVSTAAGNKTSEALAAALLRQPRCVLAEVPFSSARKRSAIAFADAARTGIYVLGPPRCCAPAYWTNPIRLFRKSREFSALW